MVFIIPCCFPWCFLACVSCVPCIVLCSLCYPILCSVCSLCPPCLTFPMSCVGCFLSPVSVFIILSFFGYVISTSHIKMDQEKVNAGTNWSSLTSHTKVQQFLVFANLNRKFIRKIVSALVPLSTCRLVTIQVQQPDRVDEPGARTRA